ncbi:DUF1007 family protein [Vibrio sp. PP-XX7]
MSNHLLYPAIQTKRAYLISGMLLCMLVVGILLPMVSEAHPHSWIDMKTYIEGDQQKITGFKMDWRFDPMTTAYLFDGEDMSKAHRQATLNKLANSIIHNMLSTHYFTYFYNGKIPIRYQNARHPVLTEAHGKARLTFDIPLAKPYELTPHPLKLLIFDPTYYVDMSWKKRQDIILSTALQSACSFKMIEPHPTPAQVSHAMSIPADADPDDTLGQLFTQSVVLTCHAVH